jgi:phage protein D
VKDKKEIVGKARTDDEVSTMGGRESGGKSTEKAFGEALAVIGSEPVETQAEADQMAKALLNRYSLNYITGDGVCLGRPDLSAGRVIKLDGIDKRFSGRYYVTGAIHHYTAESGYRTRFKARRNAW